MLFSNAILFSHVEHYKYNISVWIWSYTMNISSALWVLMAWCFSTRASVATLLNTHPCVSSCLGVKTKKKTPHGSPSQMSYGMSIMGNLEKCPRLHCTQQFTEKFTSTCEVKVTSTFEVKVTVQACDCRHPAKALVRNKCPSVQILLQKFTTDTNTK